MSAVQLHRKSSVNSCVAVEVNVALWTLSGVGEKVRLQYTHEPLSDNPLIQPCGEIDIEAESDLEAWVFDTAGVWDLIVTRRGGTFVRQAFYSERITPPTVDDSHPAVRA